MVAERPQESERESFVTIALWIVNIIAALVFFAAGLMKAARSKEKVVVSGMGWAETVPAAGVTAIGLIEVIGALGLILPIATGIAPYLAPIAAVGLAIVMVGAIVVHVRRKESAASAVVLLLLSVVSAVLGFLVV